MIKTKFNKTLRSGLERFKHIPGVSAIDLLHYIDVICWTLEEQNFEAAIFQAGIDDLLYHSSLRQINLFLQNINVIGKNAKAMELNVFISSLPYNNRVAASLVTQRNT